jgi:hypothetical protein
VDLAGRDFDLAKRKMENVEPAADGRVERSGAAGEDEGDVVWLSDVS